VVDFSSSVTTVSAPLVPPSIDLTVTTTVLGCFGAIRLIWSSGGSGDGTIE